MAQTVGAYLWNLIHSDSPPIPQFAVSMKTADESLCKQVVSIISKVIKAEGESPRAKLCALRVRTQIDAA